MQNVKLFAAQRAAAAGLIALLIAYLLLAAAYGLATPDLEAPDAGAHFRYVAFLHDRWQAPDYDLPTALISHELVQQPPLYYAVVAAALTSVPLQETLVYEKAVQTAYFEKGLSKRVTVSPPDTAAATLLPLRVARAVSLLGGLLAVSTTWLLLHTLLPRRAGMVLAVTAVVAFNPQFLFTSTTISNDMWTAALATAAVCAAVVVAQKPQRMAAWFLVGILCGLATLTKYSAALTAVPVAVVILWPWLGGRHGYAWLRRIGKGALAGLGFAAITAPQFVHNWRQLGELFPMQPIRTLLPGLVRAEPLDATELWSRVAFLSRSYSGIFGYGIRASSGYFELLDLALWLALAGGGVLLLKWLVWPERRQDRDLMFAFVLSLVWFGVLLGSLSVWIRIMIAGEQGRLLFPAGAALATLLVLGWIGWLPSRGQSAAAALLSGCLLLVGIWQLPTVRATYATPPALAEPVTPQRVTDATFAGGIELVGFDLPAGAASTFTEPLPLVLYFRADQPIAQDYTVFLHLADDENRMLYQFDGVPYQGRHPPRQWRVGEIFADSYLLAPALPLTPTLATLSLGFYPVGRPDERLPVQSAEGQVLGDRLQLAKIRLLAEPAAAQSGTEPVARWQNGIVLEDVTVLQEEQGAPRALRLRWGSEQIIQRDYTVFVQALDAAGNLVAQIDQPPQQGRAPTSTWLAQDEIVDDLFFTQSLAGWHEIIVGLYDAEDRRLPLAGPDGGDHVVVLQSPT